MLLEVIALGCAALIGFAAHRASLCNVRAVAETMTTGSAHMLWSLLQAVLWMATLTGVLVLAFGVVPQPAWARAPALWAWAGGALFGVGAAVNGGCSLSTLTRLADGEVGMIAALGGFALGVSTWLVVAARDHCRTSAHQGATGSMAQPSAEAARLFPFERAALLRRGDHAGQQAEHQPAMPRRRGGVIAERIQDFAAQVVGVGPRALGGIQQAGGQPHQRR